ncbi:MAG: YceI family protein [Phycisphaerae bacterium]
MENVRNYRTCLWVLVLSPVSHGAVPGAKSEQLLVFVAPVQASALAASFQREHLPAIEKLAARMGVPLRVMDIRDGAPPEVTITPLIVLQNRLGRSIYQGRYTSLDRIRNFIRTSSVVVQGSATLVRKEIAVWRTGRAVVASPIKVAPLSGTRPDRYDERAFVKEARAAITRGFSRFRFEKEIRLRRGDRLFYMDLNPWLSQDGTLFLSAVLFSQFHCKRPVFEQGGEAIRGPWARRGKLFQRAASVLEKAVMEQLRSSPWGGGFDPVTSATPPKSWTALGLSLPAAAKTAGRGAAGPALGGRWCVEPAGKDAPPRLVFRFPPPLDQYSGEVTRVSGEIRVPANGSLREAAGSFKADPKSVTMGDPDLDHALQTASYFLETQTHPTSSFVIKSIETDGGPLAYGDLTTVTMRGTFTMKGVSIPLVVRTMFEPVVHEDGVPRLLLRGGFEIPLPPFKIDGPDPPEDGSNAHERLMFDFSLTLRPTGNPSECGHR